MIQLFFILMSIMVLVVGLYRAKTLRVRANFIWSLIIALSYLALAQLGQQGFVFFVVLGSAIGLFFELEIIRGQKKI